MTIKDFHNSAEFRTIDVVASIPVLMAQLYCLTKIDGYEAFFGEDFKLD